MTNGKRKGKKGERELARELTKLSGRPWQRGVGQDRDGDEVPDVERADCETEAWIEAKRQKRCSWRAALKQAQEAAPEGVPCWALTRDDHGQWVLHVELADVWSLLRLAADAEMVRRKEHAKACGFELIRIEEGGE